MTEFKMTAAGQKGAVVRRKDKEVAQIAEIESIIKNCEVCRLGLTNGNAPYVVPLCFGYEKNVLYFHSAAKGQKIELLRENPNVCFEFDTVFEVVKSDEPCAWSMKYQSVIGFGKAVFVESTEEKRKALDVILAHYSNRDFEFPEKKVRATAVIKVEIDSMTCKQSGF